MPTNMEQEQGLKIRAKRRVPISRKVGGDGGGGGGLAVTDYYFLTRTL